MHSGIKVDSETLSIGLHLLADYRNYNLLLIAAEKGDFYITNFMLDAGFSTDSHDTNAQTLAYKGRHFEILFSLLKSNLTYPKNIKIEECPDEIKNFYEISQNLHEAIMSKNIAKIDELLLKHQEIHHFYNLNNESVMAFALRNKLFDMYELLISKDVRFGPYENFSAIKEKLNEGERTKLREINYKESKFLPDNHMHILLSNSRLAPSTTYYKQKYDIIQKSFEILNENPFIKIILLIVAASRNFRIVFDFNRNSVELIDPTAEATTKGLFYSFGRIYVASKELLNPRTKLEALGTLVHELCHYAMNIVYENVARPYLSDDEITEKEFVDISKDCFNNKEKEKIIKLVYECYPINMQHAELIVRVPHLMMLYSNNEIQFKKTRSDFIKLFEIYEQKIVKEMEEALPQIEAKSEVETQDNRRKIRNLILILIAVVVLSVTGIFSAIFITRSLTETINYKFNELSLEKQNIVMEAPVSYKNVQLQFQELFSKNSTAYEELSSDHISQMLHKVPINFNDSRFKYLEDLITHNWINLAPKLKDKILNSTLNFQNVILKFDVINNINSELLTYLNSSQIVNILNGNQSIVHKMVERHVNFYIERKVSDEDIYAIYFLFMEYMQGYELFSCESYNKANISMSFKSFYHGFRAQDKYKQKQKIKEIKKNSIFKKCSISSFIIQSFVGYETMPVDILLMHKSLQFGIEEILEIANKTKIFILSGEAGTGKTVMFKELAIRIKNKFPTKWVSYIDLKDHKTLYRNVYSLNDVEKMLKNIFKLNSKNEFEKKIFEHLFASGEVVLLWNGFDEISPELSETFQIILNVIRKESNILQFLCTRSLYSDMLNDNLKVKIYSLVPFDLADQNDFVMRFLISKNFTDERILYYMDKIFDVAKLSGSENSFDTPLMLQLIAELVSNDVELGTNSNLYKIYEKFVDKKFSIWIQTDYSQKIFIPFLKTGFNVMKFYQSFALKSEFQDYQDKLPYFWSLKLELMSQIPPPELNDAEVSRMGILYINDPKNFKFAHKTFIEFFIAQYLIENIYNANDTPSDEELQSRLITLYYCIGHSGVRKFFNSYLELKNNRQSTLFSPGISSLLKSKFQKMFIYPTSFDDDTFSFLFGFFGKDHEVLIKLLQIDENETVYTATFNYVHVESLKFDRLDIKNLAKPYLNRNEYRKFVNGKNQKGIILFSLYCLRNKDRTIQNISHDIYALDDELIKSDDPSYVFQTIVKMLTKDEFKELLKSDIIFKPLRTKNGSEAYIFDRNKWNLVEAIFTISEQKEIIEHIFDGFTHLIDADDTVFLLNEMAEHFTDSEIFKKFFDYRILEYAVNFKTTFNITWNFFINHTTQEQQKTFLQHKQPSQYTLTKDPYDVYISLNLLLRSFTSIERNIHDTVVDIYKSYFNTTEIQEIILSSSSDSNLLIFMMSDWSKFKNLIDFLKKCFSGRRNDLEKFLNRPIFPTNLNLIEILKNYNDPWDLMELLDEDD